MQRSVSACALAVLAAAVLVLPVRAAEKAAKSASAAIAGNAATDAREQVRQALLAETLGDNDERGRRLANALLSAPDLPEANWHAARVRIDGEWLPLSQVVNRTTSDPNQQKYRDLREKAAGSIKALRDLARWCKKNDLPDVARLHYAQLLANGNADAEMKQEAVKELDLRQVGGVWLTNEELQARQERANVVEKSLAKWRPYLTKLQAVVDGENYPARDKAIAELHKLDDPQIIPALEDFLFTSGERFSEEVVKLLARFPEHEATQTLARYAVLSEFAPTRNAAISALRGRPMHEYVPLLLSGLVAPLKSQFQVVWDRSGKVNYLHAVMQEGLSRNLLLVSHQLAVLQVYSDRTSTRDVKLVPRTEPAKTETQTYVAGISPLEAFAEQQAHAARQAANAESQVRLANSQADAANSRIIAALEGATGQTSRGPNGWWSWWQQYNEYTWPKPTQYVYRSNSYAYYAGTSTYSETTGTRHPLVPGPRSCFLAGTPVRTQAGQVPIESIKPGDRVLSQDQDTGELTYKVVLTTTLRPPAEMLAIQIDGEKIVTTLGHPFWVAGHGWRMAKELKPGDLLHRLGGAVRISAIEPAPEARAHNLVVDDFNTYFVGQSGLLVHDNEFRKPTRAIVPGLTE